MNRKDSLRRRAVALAILVIGLFVVQGQLSQADPVSPSSWWPGDYVYSDREYLILGVNIYSNPEPDHVRWYDPEANQTYFCPEGSGSFSSAYYEYMSGVLIAVHYYYTVPGRAGSIRKYRDNYSAGVAASRDYFFYIADEGRAIGQYTVEGCDTASCDTVLFTDDFEIDHRHKAYLPLVVRQAD